MNGAAPSDAPWQVFEREVRRREEGQFARDLVHADAALGFSLADKDAFLRALGECYPEGHWARQADAYPCAADAGLQLLLARLVAIAPAPSQSWSNVCVRTVRSPRVSPYLRKPNLIVVPTGFLISVSTFVRTVFAAAVAGAVLSDPNKETDQWDDERVVHAQHLLIDQSGEAYLGAIFHAVQPTANSLALQSFSDNLRAAGLASDFLKRIAEMMPTSRTSIGEASLARHPRTEAMANAIVLLTIAFALSHELGHALCVEAAESLGNHPERADADNLARDEQLADTFGFGIFYRLMDSGATQIFTGRTCSIADYCSTAAAFYNWSLSVQLTGVMVASGDENQRRALDALVEVSARWRKARQLLHELHRGVDNTSVDEYFTSWSMPSACMLRVLLQRRGHDCDMEQAFHHLALLEHGDSAPSRILRTP